MAEHQLGVIGAGNMAEAILRGAIGAAFLRAEQIVACEVSEDRRRQVAEKIGVLCLADNRRAAACPRILLAVKPQVVGAVLEEIASAVRPEATVISIAAGIGTARIDAGLGGRGRIVRVMPNTPMLVGCGMSAIAAGPRAAGDELDWTEKLFAAGGRTVRLAETMMDAVTAVSGSGPAYFFYLIEAMTDAGVQEGLPADVAAMLATQTCLGAARLLMETNLSARELRRRVTSPGGTTQRAIDTLQAAGTRGTLLRAVRDAAQRSRELGT